MLCCLTARIGSSGLAYSSHRFLRRHRTCRTWQQNTFLPIFNEVSFSLLGSDLLLSGFLIFEHFVSSVYFQKLFMRILKPQNSMRSQRFPKLKLKSSKVQPRRRFCPGAASEPASWTPFGSPGCRHSERTKEKTFSKIFANLILQVQVCIFLSLCCWHQMR